MDVITLICGFLGLVIFLMILMYCRRRHQEMMQRWKVGLELKCENHEVWIEAYARAQRKKK